MFFQAFAFLALVMVAAILSFGFLAGTAALAAKVVLFIGLVLFVISALIDRQPIA